MLWTITRDLWAEESPEDGSTVGWGTYKGDNPARDLPRRFRLRDDDGEVCAEGRCEREDGEDIFAPLDIGKGIWGCTEIQIRDGRGGWETV